MNTNETTVEHWMEGERIPPQSFTDSSRRMIEQYYPNNFSEIAVPGDPEYKELREREKENPEDPKDQQKLILRKNGQTLQTLSEVSKTSIDTIRAVLAGRNPVNPAAPGFMTDLMVMGNIARACNVPLVEFPWLHPDQQRWAYSITMTRKEALDRGIDPDTDEGRSILIGKAAAAINQSRTA